MPETNPTPADLEVAAATGAAHALIAVAATRAAGAATTPDAEGAEVVWGYAPDVPYEPVHGSETAQQHDAYMDAWYDVVHATLVHGGVRIELDDGWQIKVVPL